MWESRTAAITDETADSLVAFRSQVVDLFQRAEADKRKVLTLSRWKGWFNDGR